MATKTLTGFKGGPELQSFLDQLPGKVQKNVMRAALRQGANVIRDEARTLVPKETGTLRKSIKVSTNSKGTQVSARIRAGDKKAFYAHFVEYGTQPHSVKSRANVSHGKLQDGTPHPGARPKPFMRPAADNKQREAIAKVGEALRTRLSTQHGLNAPAIEIDDE